MDIAPSASDVHLDRLQYWLNPEQAEPRNPICFPGFLELARFIDWLKEQEPLSPAETTARELAIKLGAKPRRRVRSFGRWSVRMTGNKTAGGSYVSRFEGDDRPNHGPRLALAVFDLVHPISQSRRVDVTSFFAPPNQLRLFGRPQGNWLHLAHQWNLEGDNEHILVLTLGPKRMRLATIDQGDTRQVYTRDTTRLEGPHSSGGDKTLRFAG